MLICKQNGEEYGNKKYVQIVEVHQMPFLSTMEPAELGRLLEVEYLQLVGTWKIIR